MQRLMLNDAKLQHLILIGPFKAVGDFVLSRYGADVSFAVSEGTPQAKAEFLNDWHQARQLQTS